MHYKWWLGSIWNKNLPIYFLWKYIYVYINLNWSWKYQTIKQDLCIATVICVSVVIYVKIDFSEKRLEYQFRFYCFRNNLLFIFIKNKCLFTCFKKCLINLHATHWTQIELRRQKKSTQVSILFLCRAWNFFSFHWKSKKHLLRKSLLIHSFSYTCVFICMYVCMYMHVHFTHTPAHAINKQCYIN